MGTVNSSEETRSRARRLAENIGSFHSDLTIDPVIQAHEQLVEKSLDIKTKYVSEGGTRGESLAKENVQARSRMVSNFHISHLKLCTLYEVDYILKWTPRPRLFHVLTEMGC